MKSSLTGTENEYITEYRSRNRDFPHQSTADQFFDETQFEVYRALGYKVANSVFPVDLNANSTSEQIFGGLRQRDTAVMRKYDAHFDLLDHRRAIDRLLAKPELAGYAREIYSREGAKAETAGPPIHDAIQCYELQRVCNAQLQLMERALIALRLDDPRNRTRHSNIGWMELFRQWGGAPTFAHLWRENIGSYSTALRDFCEDELRLAPTAPGDPAIPPRRPAYSHRAHRPTGSPP